MKRSVRVGSFLALAGILLLGTSSNAFASWHDDGPYYHGYWGRGHRRGFYGGGIVVVTPRPVCRTRVVEVERPQALCAPEESIFVVNIPNDNGSYTPVTLRRVGNVYVGPRGEQYFNVPSVEQLKAVYGLK